jgi:UDP-N-acetylmuramoyl-tripeptide--D-alanyl-D-alanine ligase
MTWDDAIVHAALELGGGGSDPSLVFNGVSTDTREIPPGALFVALRGERFNAHAFLAQAAASGARGAIVDHVPENAPKNIVYYVVEDTTKALGLLARYRRRQLSARVCAITGSNGKTTTKELLRTALGARYRVHATSGNLNNLIGAPLTLLGTPSDTEVLIMELGTSSPGEIAQLGAIVEPDAALVTGISEEHLEGLGDLQGVLAEETALLADLAQNSITIVSDEPAVLAERARKLARNVKVAGFSERADADLRAADVRLDDKGQVHFRWQGHAVFVPLRGRHNARNAMLALGLAVAWGVTADDAIAALAKIQPARMRGEVHQYGALTVIADCYNSNPASLDAAIDLLVSMPRGGGRVAVVGSMLELGPASDTLHRQAAQRIAESDIDLIVATGDFIKAFAAIGDLGERLITARDAPSAWQPLSEKLKGTEVVLLKGSRGVALERLLPRLEERWADDHDGDDAVPHSGA